MPWLDAAAKLVVDCWQDTGTCRQIGMGVGFIPYDAVMLWADRNGCDHEVTVMLWNALHIVDVNFLQREAERAKAAAKT